MQGALQPAAIERDPELQRAHLAAVLRREIMEHLKQIGLDAGAPQTKESVRIAHSLQRAELREGESHSIGKHVERLIQRFATGAEVDPRGIKPRLVVVQPDSDDALLFRLATSLWSVPVSRGYGRRMRFIVVDEQNQKLIGLFALGDPVFNLRVRDEWIGWDADDRRARLVNVMDAFVAGAVPPYSTILGGKLIVALMGAKDVVVEFRKKYRAAVGGISNEAKHPRLALVTVTSALGRSSLYNRVRLPDLLELEKVGVTEGWGHFHVPEHLFLLMRELLAMSQHKYADGHQFGDGPNWRLRVIRQALHEIGMDGNVLRHGIQREVYGMPLAANWREFLIGDDLRLRGGPPPASALASAALNRWVIPRAARRPDFAAWTLDDLRRLLLPGVVGESPGLEQEGGRQLNLLPPFKPANGLD